MKNNERIDSLFLMISDCRIRLTFKLLKIKINICLLVILLKVISDKKDKKK